MSRIPVDFPVPQIPRPADSFIAACERLLAERGQPSAHVHCLDTAGPGRVFDDGGLRIASVDAGPDAGALEVVYTFAAGDRPPVVTPVVQRLPGFRLTRVCSHWLYGHTRVLQCQQGAPVRGPIPGLHYEQFDSGVSSSQLALGA